MWADVREPVEESLHDEFQHQLSVSVALDLVHTKVGSAGSHLPCKQVLPASRKVGTWGSCGSFEFLWPCLLCDAAWFVLRM